MEVAETGALFLGERPVVRERRFDGEIKSEAVLPLGPAFTKPIVVLVNDVTASGAELLAGALQNYNRAVIVGADHTVGAAFVQAVLELKAFMPRMPNSAATGMTRLTVGEFFLPNGASPQPNGISPDILVPGVSFQAKRPVIGPLTPDKATLPKLSEPDPTWAAHLATLRQRNEQRMTDLPELQHLQRWSAALKQSPAAPTGDLAQVRQWLEQRRTDKAEFEKELRQLQPQSQFTQAGQFGSGSTSTSNSAPLGADRTLDVELNEALRVLSDLVEMDSRTKPAATTASAL